MNKMSFPCLKYFLMPNAVVSKHLDHECHGEVSIVVSHATLFIFTFTTSTLYVCAIKFISCMNLK